MGNALLKPQNDKLGHKIEEMSVAEKVERLFELVDFDGDGIIDWDEVQRFFKQHGSAKTEQSRVLEVDEFMWNFDRDGNEKIDFNEFKVGLSKIGVSQDTAQLNSLVFTLEKEQILLP